MSMTREQLQQHMARAIRAHLEMDEQLLIGKMMMEQPARMIAMMGTRGGERFTDADFAAFMLNCAKRVNVGGTT
jgi:hypothetical protein